MHNLFLDYGSDVILRNKTSGGHIRVLTDNSVENMRMIDTETTFNEGGADINFRIEGANDTNLFIYLN